jgi:hypothetical protein
MDTDPTRRPNIQRILASLCETGSTDGFTEAMQVRLLKAYIQQYLHFYKLVYIAAFIATNELVDEVVTSILASFFGPRAFAATHMIGTFVAHFRMLLGKFRTFSW